MNAYYNKGFTFLLFLISTLLIACEPSEQSPSAQTTINTAPTNEANLEQSVAQYKSELETVQAQLDAMIVQNEFLITVINDLTENLSENEMIQFSRNLITYDLTVNGESIPPTGQMTIAPGAVVILLSQIDQDSTILDSKWSDKGKLTGDYFDHLIEFNDTNWTLTGTDGTYNTSRGYEKAHLKVGEVITFSVTDDLKERLNLDTNVIEIKIK